MHQEPGTGLGIPATAAVIVEKLPPEGLSTVRVLLAVQVTADAGVAAAKNSAANREVEIRDTP